MSANSSLSPVKTISQSRWTELTRGETLQQDLPYPIADMHQSVKMHFASITLFKNVRRSDPRFL